MNAGRTLLVVGGVQNVIYSPILKKHKYFGTDMSITNKTAALLMLLGLSHSVAADSAAGIGGISTAFSKNSTSVGVVVGSGRAFNDDYLIMGVGASYYLAKGLELGIDAQHWFFGDPSITKVSPKITYVFTQPKVIKPYLGVFYRRTFYGDYNGRSIDSENSYGYRAGAYFNTNNRVYIGGGIVYEQYTDCNELYDCSTTYPEIIFSVSF
ncbi:MAG: outer membrane beta-barrel protein [Motiliproteus sp.]